MADSERSDSSYGDDFCSEDRASIEGCAQYLQQELQMIGLPSILPWESRHPETSRLINSVYRLLQLYRHNLRTIEELKTSLQRARSDFLLHQDTQTRLKEDLKSSEREIAVLVEGERQLNLKIKTLSSKLRAEQEEVRRLKLNMQFKETQFVHESKKREKEYDRLKQKLGQLVSDKSQERRLGMSMLNSLQRADYKRRTWSKPGSSDEEMYRVIITNYEERQKELMVENASLRESLAGLQKELVGLLNKRQGQRQEPTTSSEVEGESPVPTAPSEDLISSGHFQMPYDIVRDGIEQNFRDKCQRIKEHIEELRSRIDRLESDQVEGEPSERDSEIEQLEHKLSDYREIIGQQEELLQRTSEEKEEQSQGKRSSDFLNESRVWRERERLEGERKLFQDERESFEREKEKYMEAIRRLDRERQSFEDDKAAFLREQFLDASIFNTTKELDSFFLKLSSTPASKAESSPRFRGEPQSLEVDLQHSLSLCSDDGGVSVLNEKPEHTEDKEDSDAPSSS